jgi:hypothetical protein
MLAEVGDQIAVLVDLKPRLPYRSRELRSLAVKTYWSSSGSSVARLRRALAAANRHLARFNDKATPGSKCSGSLTCAVFSGDELFLGQVGPAYAFVLHPPDKGLGLSEIDEFELYPPRDRLLVPLGAAVPPHIHVGYTPMCPDSTILLATTPIAESQSRELWRQRLALPEFNDLTAKIIQEVTTGKISGTVISIRALSESEPQPRRRSSTRAHRHFITGRAEPAASASRQTTTARSKSPATPRSDAKSRRERKPSVRPVNLVPQFQPRSQAAARALGRTSSPVRSDRPSEKGAPPAVKAESVSEAEDPQRRQRVSTEPVEKSLKSRSHVEPPESEKPQPAFEPRVPLTKRVGAWFQRLKRHRELMRSQRERTTDRTVTAERARLRRALRLVLPGKVEGVSTSTPRRPPPENPSVMGGIAFGLILIVFFISMTKHMQLGGPLKAQELMEEARTLREVAYETQSLEDWRDLRDVSDQIVDMDPLRTEALELKVEAQQAIEALENAAVLSVHPLLELGTSPQPRRILVVDDWIYVLDTWADTMVGLPLDEDRISTSSDTVTTILRKGQTLNGETVGELVDFAWLTAVEPFSDGAILVYQEGGTLLFYEPTMGPGSVDAQQVEGDLSHGSVTAIETFGNQFYLLHRASNQILVYEPINGSYDSPPDRYFAENIAPEMRLVLDIAIDGRIYLLMGDGSVDTYFDGTADPSFEIRDLADPDFMPMVMALESDPGQGLVYFGDSRLERFVVVDKAGNLKHQFRLPRGGLRQIEALSVNEEPHVLFFVAENRLYAAKLPDFVN